MTSQGSALAIQGYARQATELIARYESIDCTDFYAPILDLLPSSPCRVLDIGAGTGRDSRWFAGMGHNVFAAEPVAAFLDAGRRLHGDAIHWLQDALPDLAAVRALGVQFGQLNLAGVWHHLDPHERRAAWPVLAALSGPGAGLLMALRHGTCPVDRPGHVIDPQATVADADAAGFRLLRQVGTASIQPENQRAGVTWTWLALQRKDPAA